MFDLTSLTEKDKDVLERYILRKTIDKSEIEKAKINVLLKNMKKNLEESPSTIESYF